jgi:DNA-binding PadR family transcriptional regulator
MVNYLGAGRVARHMSTDLGPVGGADARELLHFVTQQTRFGLVANVLQHPEGLPSMYELEQLNPGVSDATVYKHVQKLVDAGVLEAIELPAEERRQGYPWKFYRLTDEGRQFLADHNLLQAEETLQRMYETIADKPEKMVKYENAPRPDVE